MGRPGGVGGSRLRAIGPRRLRSFSGSGPSNAAPTLTEIATLYGTQDDPRTITYAELLAASDAADPEEAAISFRVEAVSSGTLTKGGNPVVPGTTTLGVGESLVWTPPSGVYDANNAFTVKARDAAGGLSATAVQVVVDLAALRVDRGLLAEYLLDGDFDDSSGNGEDVTVTTPGTSAFRSGGGLFTRGDSQFDCPIAIADIQAVHVCGRAWPGLIFAQAMDWLYTDNANGWKFGSSNAAASRYGSRIDQHVNLSIAAGGSTKISQALTSLPLNACMTVGVVCGTGSSGADLDRFYIEGRQSWDADVAAITTRAASYNLGRTGNVRLLNRCGLTHVVLLYSVNDQTADEAARIASYCRGIARERGEDVDGQDLANHNPMHEIVKLGDSINHFISSNIVARENDYGFRFHYYSFAVGATDPGHTNKYWEAQQYIIPRNRHGKFRLVVLTDGMNWTDEIGLGTKTTAQFLQLQRDNIDIALAYDPNTYFLRRMINVADAAAGSGYAHTAIPAMNAVLPTLASEYPDRVWVEDPLTSPSAPLFVVGAFDIPGSQYTNDGDGVHLSDDSGRTGITKYIDGEAYYANLIFQQAIADGNVYAAELPADAAHPELFEGCICAIDPLGWNDELIPNQTTLLNHTPAGEGEPTEYGAMQMSHRDPTTAFVDWTIGSETRKAVAIGGTTDDLKLYGVPITITEDAITFVINIAMDEWHSLPATQEHIFDLTNEAGTHGVRLRIPHANSGGEIRGEFRFSINGGSEVSAGGNIMLWAPDSKHSIILVVNSGGGIDVYLDGLLSWSDSTDPLDVPFTANFLIGHSGLLTTPGNPVPQAEVMDCAIYNWAIQEDDE